MSFQVEAGVTIKFQGLQDHGTIQKLYTYKYQANLMIFGVKDPTSRQEELDSLDLRILFEEVENESHVILAWCRVAIAPFNRPYSAYPSHCTFWIILDHRITPSGSHLFWQTVSWYSQPSIMPEACATVLGD